MVKNVTVTVIGEQKNSREEQTVEQKTMEDCMHVINVYPEVAYQEFHGFGGAFFY